MAAANLQASGRGESATTGFRAGVDAPAAI
jgi:hypothetical protein